MSRRNQIIERVSVQDYAAEGRALARLDGKVIFIEGGAVPGDEVDVQLVRDRKDWALARVIRFHTYAPDRVEPFCKHFGVCGGCAWQMLPYQQQLQYKQRQVEQVFQHIGQLRFPAIRPILPADPVIRYRNKAEFTASDRAFLPGQEWQTTAQKGELPPPALGYHVPRRFDRVLHIETCDLVPEPVNRLRNRVHAFVWQQQQKLGYQLFYHIKHHTGWLRGLSVRINKQQEVMANLIFAYEDQQLCQALCEMLLKEIPELSSLYVTLNAKRNDSLHDLQPKLVHGPGYLLERVGNYVFKIGPKSFFQTNSYQAERLYDQVKQLAALSGQETVYDLYCGTGSIGIYVAEGAARVIGIEQILEAVEDARENVRLNGVSHVHIQAGDVVDVWDEAFIAQHGRPDVVITDPPRAGMHARLIDRLLRIRPRVLIYVSCNPATQARDLQLLQQAYQIDVVQPVDMFPHTHHIENIVRLSSV
ncbi:MAG: 23S rRNA (uracil(1939)-C(5))-methyltransferase RlmD [Thermoflavifilum aggregans]|nr:23S rRNA (uracil(1939)-C(5))-methyltransferase RlmD [Thermoflavifilum aggregans]